MGLCRSDSGCATVCVYPAGAAAFVVIPQLHGLLDVKQMGEQKKKHKKKVALRTGICRRLMLWGKQKVFKRRVAGEGEGEG